MSKKREAFFTKVGGAFSVHCRPITTAAVGEHRPRLARLTRARGTHRPPTSQQIDKLATLAPPPCIRCARLHPVFAPPPPLASLPPYPGGKPKTTRPRNPHHIPPTQHHQHWNPPRNAANPPPCIRYPAPAEPLPAVSFQFIPPPFSSLTPPVDCSATSTSSRTPPPRNPHHQPVPAAFLLHPADPAALAS